MKLQRQEVCLRLKTYSYNVFLKNISYFFLCMCVCISVCVCISIHVSGVMCACVGARQQSQVWFSSSFLFETRSLLLLHMPDQLSNELLRIQQNPEEWGDWDCRHTLLTSFYMGSGAIGYQLEFSLPRIPQFFMQSYFLTCTAHWEVDGLFLLLYFLIHAFFYILDFYNGALPNTAFETDYTSTPYN